MVAVSKLGIALFAWFAEGTKLGDVGSVRAAHRAHAEMRHQALLSTFFAKTDPLDEASKRLVADAPAQARAKEFLTSMTDLPEEVKQAVMAKGAQIKESKRISMVTDSTWLIDLDPPLVQGDKHFARAVVSILGSQMVDYPFSFWTNTSLVMKAMELAKTAGIPVPEILAEGQIQTEIGSLGFLVQQYVPSGSSSANAKPDDDEDMRIRLSARLDQKLDSVDFASMDTAPLPRFDTELDIFHYLQTFVPSEFAMLHKSLDRIVGKVTEEEKESQKENTSPHKLHLKHPGLDGNILMSKNPHTKQWSVDAVVDWDSASIRGSSLFKPTKMNGPVVAVMFSQVAKGAYLAHCYVNGCMPICNLEKQVELYNEHAQKLVRLHELPSFQPWSALVEIARENLKD
eukprot:gb/GFBE01060000.1/.p1 GENE.gb/GFBE01060000.1/~~gb/GFBE01060000.1/.p1  ORF type:complete len:400 (+),score=105.83 gb/GFBE01060000.1/:1-1200(+)